MAEATALLLRFDACRQIRTREREREKRCTVEGSIDALASCCLFLLRSPLLPASSPSPCVKSLTYRRDHSVRGEARGGRKQRIVVLKSELGRVREQSLQDMLRVTNKVHKDQSTGQQSSDSSPDFRFSSHCLMQKARNSSLFSVPGLFVGFNSKGLSDCESVKSPTSPLDLKNCSNLGNTFLGFSKSTNLDWKPKCWGSSKVGLMSLVDVLNDDETKSSREVILFGPQMRVNSSCPKSLPKDYGIYSQFNNKSTELRRSSRMSIDSKGAESECRGFGLLRSCSAEISGSSSPLSDSKSTMENINFDKYSSSFSTSEMEESEDYTCIISHGPNPKTTHIFGDCIIERPSFPSENFKNNDNGKDQERCAWILKPSEHSLACSSTDFLSVCFHCKEKLGEGKDIYMYRGDRAFCSSDCREKEILNDEESEKATIASYFPTDSSSFHEHGQMGQLIFH